VPGCFTSSCIPPLVKSLKRHVDTADLGNTRSIGLWYTLSATCGTTWLRAGHGDSSTTLAVV
jgi:hypothetical protein